jgi:beta-phosphoglucomutase
MIRALIFDLDGTLVETESLKALSYARAAVELKPNGLTELDVLDVFKEVVGLSRREVALYLLDRFGLFEAAQQRMDEFRVDVPWQAFVQLRLRHYEEMLMDPELLRKNRCPYAIELLKQARSTPRPEGPRTGLATMSYCPQVRRVLQILAIDDHFDFVASRDDVENGKPAPEIYQLVALELGVQPHECLVIEDSPTGVKAALNAGMACIAVTTDFTRAALHDGQLLAARWIVDDPAQLAAVVQRMFDAQRDR